MGKPSSPDVLADSQLHKYMQEVNARLTPPTSERVQEPRLRLCCSHQAFGMTESEHAALMDKVEKTEVRKRSWHVPAQTSPESPAVLPVTETI